MIKRSQDWWMGAGILAIIWLCVLTCALCFGALIYGMVQMVDSMHRIDAMIQAEDSAK